MSLYSAVSGLIIGDVRLQPDEARPEGRALQACVEMSLSSAVSGLIIVTSGLNRTRHGLKAVPYKRA
jgi:hypothetical protein